MCKMRKNKLSSKKILYVEDNKSDSLNENRSSYNFRVKTNYPV